MVKSDPDSRADLKNNTAASSIPEENGELEQEFDKLIE